MYKVKYMINRILKMNYGGFFKTIKDLHEKTNKNRILLFFDIVFTGLIFGAGYMDYQLFEMYKMTFKEKKTVVTRSKNNELIKKFNNKEYFKYLHDKVLFNEKFDKYLNRDWLMVSEKDFNKFKTFTKKHPVFMAKPVDESCGRGIEKIDIKDKSLKETFDSIIKNRQFLLEEVAVQCDEISKLHPSSINTIRIVTLKGKVVLAFLRIGNSNNVVDNFNHGGMVTPIDTSDGVIKYPALDKSHNLFEVHPLTNEKIVGLKIPRWNKVKELVEEASTVIPELGYVGWDVCVGEEKPFLIEGNEFPGHDIYQLPPHRSTNTGLWPLFQEILDQDK